MRIDVFDNYGYFDLYDYDIVIMGNIDWNSDGLIELLECIKEDEFNYAEFLNNINNQGITAVYIKDRLFEVSQKTYTFANMATSEQIFFIAKAADRFKKKVLFHGIAVELDTQTVKLFYNEFSKSQYVDLSFVDERDKEVFLWSVE